MTWAFVEQKIQDIKRIVYTHQQKWNKYVEFVHSLDEKAQKRSLQKINRKTKYME